MNTQTQTIFDSWITYPSIFILKTNQSVKIVSKTHIKPFFLCPEKLKDVSMIRLLKNQFGLKVGQNMTFQTGYISTKNQTKFNGNEFRLKLKGDFVLLETNKLFEISRWNINDIVSSMKSKNTSERIITKDFVVNLLQEGKLQVKFNVSKIKDHGTEWKVIS